jgi:transposase-like protein
VNVPITASNPFKCRHYQGDIILWCVRWYLRFDFLLTDWRNATAAKRFFRRALRNNNAMPRVVTVDKNPAYPRAVTELKADGTINRRCRLRQCKYRNNIVEQDHRNVKRRAWLAKGYGSLSTAWRTLRGIEAMEMVRKGRAKWVAKSDVAGQVMFINSLFGIAA